MLGSDLVPFISLSLFDGINSEVESLHHGYNMPSDRNKFKLLNLPAMTPETTLLHHLCIQLRDEYLENAQAAASAEVKLRFSLDSTEFID
jgi:hypothetical protein